MRYAFLLSALLCPLLALSQPPAPTPREGGTNKQEQAAKTNDKARDAKQPTGVFPVSVSGLQPQPVNEKTTAKEEREDHYSSAEWLIAISTLALAGITGFLAFFTLRLWRSTGELVKGAENTAERQLRAYVFTDATTISDIKANGNICINIKIKNSGQTPAYGLTCVVESNLFDFPVFVFPELKALQVESNRSKSNLPPGGFFESGITGRPFTQEERSAVIAGTKAIYVYGEIHYIDAFDIKRTTTFRYMCGGDSGVCAGEMHTCNEGNEAT